MAIAETTASPSAPPTCWEAFSTVAAGRARSADTPSLAAVVTATKYRHGDSNPVRGPLGEPVWLCDGARKPL